MFPLCHDANHDEIKLYQGNKKGAHNETQHQNSARPKTNPIDCDGVQLTNVTWNLYPNHDIGNPELYNWNNWNVHLQPNRKE